VSPAEDVGQEHTPHLGRTDQVRLDRAGEPGRVAGQEVSVQVGGGTVAGTEVGLNGLDAPVICRE
jgi:hypothetical protein